ncbi:Small integral membrane protein 29 [Frankliniella fusca]|uniref:Small integral membrane protein 29 n=1 Tax=Frankliniella fusca TaxID=407009 RepID=A0AAE1LBL6_9NEOP|nr:Small integral membrane protein 29 [Frankliniella fusca]
MHNGALNFTFKLPVLSTSTSLPNLHPLPKHETEHWHGTVQLIIVPVVAFAIVIILSGLHIDQFLLQVILYRKKRRNDQLRHHLMPLYDFDASDDDQEWETELLDEFMEQQSVRMGYKSIEFLPSLNRS